MKSVLNKKASVLAKSLMSMTVVALLAGCQLTLAHTSAPTERSPSERASTPAVSATELPLHAITPEESYQVLLNNSDVVLIDVRGPSEVRFDGNVEYTRVHVPLMFVNTDGWNEAANAYAMKPNENFLAEVERDFERLQVTKEQKLIFMCRSGIRGQQAANVLREAGYTNVHYMLGGFDGYDPEGHPGWRAVGLPWVESIRRDVAWGGHRR